MVYPHNRILCSGKKEQGNILGKATEGFPRHIVMLKNQGVAHVDYLATICIKKREKI